MNDTRYKDSNWKIELNQLGRINTDCAQLALLMDLRDELKKLNQVFECRRFIDIPSVLNTIARNTRKSLKRARKVTK